MASLYDAIDPSRYEPDSPDYTVSPLSAGAPYTLSPEEQAYRDRLLAILMQPEPTVPPYTPQPLTTKQRIGEGISGLADVIAAIGHARTRGLTPLTQNTLDLFDTLHAQQRQDQNRMTEAKASAWRGRQKSALLQYQDWREGIKEAERRHLQAQKDAADAEDAAAKARQHAIERQQDLEMHQAQLDISRQNLGLSKQREARLSQPEPQAEPKPDKVAERQQAEIARKAGVTLQKKFDAVSAMMAGSTPQGIILKKGDQSEEHSLADVKQSLLDAYVAELGRPLSNQEQIQFNDMWDTYIMRRWSKLPLGPSGGQPVAP